MELKNCLFPLKYPKLSNSVFDEDCILVFLSNMLYLFMNKFRINKLMKLKLAERKSTITNLIEKKISLMLSANFILVFMRIMVCIEKLNHLISNRKNHLASLRESLSLLKILKRRLKIDRNQNHISRRLIKNYSMILINLLNLHLLKIIRNPKPLRNYLKIKFQNFQAAIFMIHYLKKIKMKSKE